MVLQDTRCSEWCIRRSRSLPVIPGLGLTVVPILQFSLFFVVGPFSASADSCCGADSATSLANSGGDKPQSKAGGTRGRWVVEDEIYALRSPVQHRKNKEQYKGKKNIFVKKILCELCKLQMALSWRPFIEQNGDKTIVHS